MPTIAELKEKLKSLKSTHPEIRYTGLKKPELEKLVQKYTTAAAPTSVPKEKEVIEKKPTMATMEELVRNKKMSVDEFVKGEKESKAPTIKSNFSKGEYERVRDELDTGIMDAHDYSSIGLAYPLDESKNSIIPKLTERSEKLYYNYKREDQRLTDKISKYLEQVIEWIKSNSVKRENGTSVITIKKYEELFK